MTGGEFSKIVIHKICLSFFLMRQKTEVIDLSFTYL